MDNNRALCTSDEALNSGETPPRADDLMRKHKSDSRTITSVFGAVLLLLIILLLTGCGSSDEEDRDERAKAVTGPSTSEAPVQVANTPETTVETSAISPGGSEDDTTRAEANISNSASDVLPAGAEPEIGEITFALGLTPEYEPVDAGLFFAKGVTEVHAVFEYSGMSPDYTWERVWYLNDKEIGRAAEPWDGPEVGVFDYSIDNGGRPLPAGDWVLELYVEDELEAIGVFIIEEEP